MRSLTELEAVVQRETALPSPDCCAVVEAIRHALSIDPSLINELAPGMALSQRRMTPKERGKVAVLAMNIARAKHRAVLLKAAEPIVNEVLSARPTANGHEIAFALNSKCDYGPSKKRETWTYADARRLLKDLGIDVKQTEN